MKYLNHILVIFFLAFSLHTQAQSLEAAQQLAGQGQFDAARSMLEDIVQLTPDQPEAWTQLGHVCSWMGDQKSAIGHFRTALRLEEMYMPAQIGLAYAFAWDHQFKQAQQQFEHILSKDPMNLDAKKGLAYTALWRSDFSEAETYFEALITEQGPNEEFLLSKGLAQLNQDHVLAAEATFQELLELNPQHKE
ncbi:MAG: tetratricopeptide repeat protein, partial [Phaeodactylibacter sp.]|nr:tetratricopeptide repeat protein [Phaeodactylibacter sp.]